MPNVNSQGEVDDAPVTGITLVEEMMLSAGLKQAQIDFIRQRTPPSEIYTRPGKGGMEFNYVKHQYVTERLNILFGFNWSFAIKEWHINENCVPTKGNKPGGEVEVLGHLTVKLPNGQVVEKEQFGQSDIKRSLAGVPLSIADDKKAAASDALKKCASLLGIALDVYGRDPSEEYEGTEEAPQPQPQPQQRPQLPQARWPAPRPQERPTVPQTRLPQDIAPDDPDWASLGQAVEQINIPQETPWEKFVRYAKAYMVKIGCSDKLVNAMLSTIKIDMTSRGEIDSDEMLQAMFHTIKTMNRSGEISLYLNQLEQALIADGIMRSGSM